MGRILAIDYGSKRCGIAVTDELQLIASALTTVAAKELVSWLVRYTSEEPVDLCIIGEPKRMHNVPSDIEVEIQKCIQQIGKALPNLLLKRIDERFTSKMATSALIASGASKKKRREKGLIDQISATILLQDYLQYYK